MSTYEMNIDTVNSSLSYYQAEKYNLSRLLGIYGSSRLGMLKDSVNVLGSAFTNTDSTNVTHTLGNKRYELSNHLGNVLTVITDKPIPHNNGGTVDYWQASIASAYDYSPFGVMLTGRTFEGKQTICEDSTTLITQNTLQEGFNSWGSWTTMGSALLTYVSGEMQVSNPNTSKKDIGASKAFTTGTGLHNVSFEVIGNTCATVVIWPPSSTPIPINVSVKDNYGNVVASGNYTTAGTYNLSFTPASSSATYSLEFHMTNASAFCFFRVDDVLVSYDDTTTVTVCKEVEEGYRYGFNGMEKDDEAKGKGNSYTTEFRQYDPRLGRWLSLDPLAHHFPWQSPYVAFDNNPIYYVDPSGLASEGWIENKKTGELKWDKNVNTQDEFDKSDYNKNDFSYAGQETQRAYLVENTMGYMYTEYFGSDGKSSVYDYPMWVETAKDYMGLTEGKNPTIQAMIDKLNTDYGFSNKDVKPINNDSDPWCGVFVYWSLTNTGYSATTDPSSKDSWKTPAKSEWWLYNWEEGVKLNKPAFGAIVRMNYSHVAIVVGYDDKYVWLLGGNQAKNDSAVRDGVEVNISKVSRSLVTGYMLPKSYKKPPLDTFE